MYGFNSTVGALAEIWSLAAVNWDRYQAIFNPLDRDKRITKSQVFLIKEKFNICTEHYATSKQPIIFSDNSLISLYRQT